MGRDRELWVNFKHQHKCDGSHQKVRWCGARKSKKILSGKKSNVTGTIHPQIPKIDKSPNMSKMTPRPSTVTLWTDRASTAAREWLRGRR